MDKNQLQMLEDSSTLLQAVKRPNWIRRRIPHPP